MKRKHSPRDLCAETHEDDGLNPRDDKREDVQGHTRKDLQLCKQVRRALDTHLAMATWAAPPALRLEEVAPDPDASRLRLKVSWRNPAWSLAHLLALLNAHRAELRWAAAGAITRKRTPELTFEAVPGRDEEVAP